MQNNFDKKKSVAKLRFLRFLKVFRVRQYCFNVQHFSPRSFYSDIGVCAVYFKFEIKKKNKKKNSFNLENICFG